MAQWKADTLKQKPATAVGVDCHVHLFPDDLFTAIAGWFSKAGWDLPYPCRAEDVVRWMQHFGVESFWALPYAHKGGISRGLNRFIAEFAARHPMVTPFFTVSPLDDDVEAEARYAVETLGSRGMKIHAEVQQVGLDDSRLDPAFDLLEERGLPCVLHAGNAPYPEEMAILSIDRMRGRMAKNPNLTAVIGHLGSPDTPEYLAMLGQYPNLHLEVSFTNIPPVHQIENPPPATLAPYVDRLLFGSDFPYLTFPYCWQADAWARLPWVQENAAAFFGGTARRLVGS
jgi:uncharacterized protein